MSERKTLGIGIVIVRCKHCGAEKELNLADPFEFALFHKVVNKNVTCADCNNVAKWSYRTDPRLGQAGIQSIGDITVKQPHRTATEIAQEESQKILQDQALKEEEFRNHILADSFKSNKEYKTNVARELNSKMLHLQVGKSYLVLNDVELYVESVSTYIEKDGSVVGKIVLKELERE